MPKFIMFRGPGGGSAVADALRSLPRDDFTHVTECMAKKERGEWPRGKDEHVHGDIWELRIPFDGLSYRLFYARRGDAYVALVFADKRSRRIPKDIKQAIKNLKIYDGNRD